MLVTWKGEKGNDEQKFHCTLRNISNRAAMNEYRVAFEPPRNIFVSQTKRMHKLDTCKAKLELGARGDKFASIPKQSSSTEISSVASERSGQGNAPVFVICKQAPV